jgi:hypothetical protein
MTSEKRQQVAEWLANEIAHRDGLKRQIATMEGNPYAARKIADRVREIGHCERTMARLEGSVT